jgi:hypothetical protein
VLGHDDLYRDAESGPVVGDGLGMIARTRGHYSAPPLLRREGEHSIERAAILEGAGALQALQLDVKRARQSIA